MCANLHIVLYVCHMKLTLSQLKRGEKFFFLGRSGHYEKVSEVGKSLEMAYKPLADHSKTFITPVDWNVKLLPETPLKLTKNTAL